MFDGDRLIRRRSIEAYKQMKNDSESQEWNLEHFYKGNSDELKAIINELNVYEKAVLFSISPYVGYTDCCIRYENGKELTIEAMQEISGISKSKMYEVLSSLQEKDILYKGKNSKNVQYFMNPYLFCKGPRINKVLKTMFKNYKIRIKNGKRLGEI